MFTWTSRTDKIFLPGMLHRSGRTKKDICFACVLVGGLAPMLAPSFGHAGFTRRADYTGT